jgi:hypothetical protein
MIAPRPSARTPGRDLSPIAQRRQQMTDSPIARLYLGCPPWRSNAQEGTAYDVPQGDYISQDTAAALSPTEQAVA